ncbi:MAG TPA: ubiquinone/menaquinone biosynthesis methyltransferase [Candidatus Hydrogenedentes bacterium]|nr:ubiquinone/menaquinone biosynthesis methyltransferase [Candidatus Hydrogenedentota bacterium]
MNSAPEGPSRRRAGEMFDRIAPRYDFLNRVLSLRRDVVWRRRMARHLPEGAALRLLDLATGTGDVMLSLCAIEPRIELALGVDVSSGMLSRARVKIARGPGRNRGRDAAAPRCGLARVDATRLALRDASFDVATIAFGIRNVIDVDAALREMRRVLRRKGRALVLEFSLPGNALLRELYLLYFRRVLPRIGGLISGDIQAYRYLNETVETFPYGEAFCALMRAAGFVEVRAVPLTFGIAMLYVGVVV